MFKKATLLTCFVVGTISFLWLFQCIWVRKSDHQLYLSFMEKQHQIDTSSKLVSQNAYQTRCGVRKDIWVAEEPSTRLHYRIESRFSVLKLLPGQSKTDIIENLSGITCWMQDKLYLEAEQPFQQVRYLEADEGTYRYTSQQFDASQVSLSLMRLAGHQLSFNYNSKDAFLRGIAQDVSFSISEGTPQFQAQQFKASLRGSEL